MTLTTVRRRLLTRGVMGMNRRNGLFIGPLNPRHRYPDVDNKRLTKALAARAGIPTPDLYAVVETNHRLREVPALVAERPTFVVKPARGAAGNGIILVTGHDRAGLTKASGERLTWEEITYHIASILSGVHSLEGLEDEALIEALVEVDPVFAAVTFRGVPDIRVVVYRGVPVMAMVRLPTRRSDGRANLHQGALGVGVSLGSGVTGSAVQGRQVVTRHPDTGHAVSGIEVPHWPSILEIAARAYEMTGLGYLGVDLVLDRVRGPVLLELNARPGLAIQLANRDGLARRAAEVEAAGLPDARPASTRVDLARRLFA